MLGNPPKGLFIELQTELRVDDGPLLLLLAALAESWDEMVAAGELLEAEGSVIVNPTTGNRRAHPAVSIPRNARQSLMPRQEKAPRYTVFLFRA